jgi:glycosyltransferase involved in cell wall biosynthesis
MSGTHIGVNALYLIPGGVGGTEIYLRSLLGALALIDNENTYTIFTNRETDARIAPMQPNFQVAPQPVWASIRPLRILWEQTVLPWEVRRRGIQVLFNPGFTAPFVRSCPNVTVFHDLQHKRHPENFRFVELIFWRILLRGAAVCSRRLIAVSKETGGDLEHFYSYPATQIQTIPHGVDAHFFEIGKIRMPEQMLLCVSTLHPHKNLDTLLRGFARFRVRYPEFRLTMAGLRGLHADELERLREELGLSNVVEFTGWIPRDNLYDLFRRASAFIYPSRFEGFGMPVLEALAAAIPSACADVEPMKSLAGSAALKFDPSSAEDICDTMEALTQDQSVRERLHSEGPLRAAQFSWESAARETLRVLLAAR